MFSAHIIYGLGIVVSSISMLIWIRLFFAAMGQFNETRQLNTTKAILVAFTVTSALSNPVPIWFYIYRLAHNTSPTNIFYAYVMSVYIYQVSSAIMFFIIYKY